MGEGGDEDGALAITSGDGRSVGCGEEEEVAGVEGLFVAAGLAGDDGDEGEVAGGRRSCGEVRIFFSTRK